MIAKAYKRGFIDVANAKSLVDLYRHAFELVPPTTARIIRSRSLHDLLLMGIDPRRNYTAEEVLDIVALNSQRDEHV